MRAAHRAILEAPAVAVVGVLHDVPRWSAWLPGCAVTSVKSGVGDAVEAALELAGPVPIQVTLEVSRPASGLRIRLVQGDPSAVVAAVSVVAGEGGTTVVWELELEFGVHVPGVWASELQREVLPAWHEALARAVRAR